jgi:hypothetical protein
MHKLDALMCRYSIHSVQRSNTWDFRFVFHIGFSEWIFTMTLILPTMCVLRRWRIATEFSGYAGEGLPLNFLATQVLAASSCTSLAVVGLASTLLRLPRVLPRWLMLSCGAGEFTAPQLAVAVMLCVGYNFLRCVPVYSLVVISALLFLKVESGTCDTYLFLKFKGYVMSFPHVYLYCL